MKYKIGDKVRIRDYCIIRTEMPCIVENRETLNNEIEKQNTNRVVTIENIVFYMSWRAYKMKEVDGCWIEELIECSFEECKRRYYINSRFDIIDL